MVGYCLFCENEGILYMIKDEKIIIKKELSFDNSFLVGVTGIEPATSWSQTTRAPSCATPRE
jgi:hypothetical protein